VSRIHSARNLAQGFVRQDKLKGNNMVEPITTIGTAAFVAYLGKDGLEKLLGPTAEYLGQGIKNFTEKRVENICSIFQNGESKLGERINSKGEVPPKVLKVIIDEGSFSTDRLSIEYLGGILASSRTELGRDDRGARMAKIVDSLSTYQLRTHYLIYSTVRKLFMDKSISLNMNGRREMQIFIPFNNYIKAMDFNADEIKQFEPITRHIFFGLHSEDLIENQFVYGPKESLFASFPKATDDGIICQPSALGAELYLWAFGYADKELDFVFSSEFSATVKDMPDLFEGALPTKQP